MTFWRISETLTRQRLPSERPFRPDSSPSRPKALRMRGASRTWKSLVQDLVASQPRRFALADILSHSDELRAHYPANRFVDAKIRQSLQVLRDQGVLRFLGAGRYERLDAEPVFSPFFDPSLAAGYSSRAQVARVLIETWAEMNLYCLNCNSDALTRLPPNTPVADFGCAKCRSSYQLKAKDGRFGAMLVGAAFAATIRAVREHTMPEHILVEFDTRRSIVIYADAVPGALIDETRIIPRRPLSANARRAGWQGCTIDVSGLPSVPLVLPMGTDRTAARRQWCALSA